MAVQPPTLDGAPTRHGDVWVTEALTRLARQMRPSRPRLSSAVVPGSGTAAAVKPMASSVTEK